MGAGLDDSFLYLHPNIRSWEEVNNSATNEYRMARRQNCTKGQCKKPAEHFVQYKIRKNQRWPVTEYLCSSHHTTEAKSLRRNPKVHELVSKRIVVIDPEKKKPLDEEVVNG